MSGKLRAQAKVGRYCGRLRLEMGQATEGTVGTLFLILRNGEAASSFLVSVSCKDGKMEKSEKSNSHLEIESNVINMEIHSHSCSCSCSGSGSGSLILIRGIISRPN